MGLLAVFFVVVPLHLFAIAALSTTPMEHLGVVSTLAGGGKEEWNDGQGTEASFYWPDGVAVDPWGDIIVADTHNHCVRRITPNGEVSTIAGTTREGYLDGPWEQAAYYYPRGLPGYLDGPGEQAAFYYPRGLAVGKDGIIYVADTSNNRIRKVTREGVVSTLAGSGKQESKDGQGTEASFNQPFGVALDPWGDIIVVDTHAHCVRRITAQGEVSTIAGTTEKGYRDGPGEQAAFHYPYGVAVGEDGIIYVADTLNNRIRKVTREGMVSTLAGSGIEGFKDGPSLEAQFHFPMGLMVTGDGSLIISDERNNRIRKLSAGVVSTLAGSGSADFKDGSLLEASFYGPIGLALTQDGKLVVSDSSNNRIRIIAGSERCPESL